MFFQIKNKIIIFIILLVNKRLIKVYLEKIRAFGLLDLK